MPVLRHQLHGFGVSLDGHTARFEIDWTLPTRGIVHLIGARGAGKRLLGRVLARHRLPDEARWWGTITVGALDWRVCQPAARVSAQSGQRAQSPLVQLATSLPPELLADLLAAPHAEGVEPTRQWARAWLDQHDAQDIPLDAPCASLSAVTRRRLAMLCACVSPPLLLIIDGFSDQLDDAPREPLIALTKRLSERMPILVLGADPQDLIALGGIGFALSARAMTPLPDVDAICAAQARLRAVKASPSLAPAPPPPPHWLRWIFYRRLAGMPRPGHDGESREALEALRAHGVTHVLCLEETHTARQHVLDAGLVAWHEPIPDMHAPSLATITTLCERLHHAMEGGAVIAVHCKAGLGRTGTVLAACLIARGHSYAQSLMLLRLINPHYIQSEVQHTLLLAFEQARNT